MEHGYYRDKEEGKTSQVSGFQELYGNCGKKEFSGYCAFFKRSELF